MLGVLPVPKGTGSPTGPLPLPRHPASPWQEGGSQGILPDVDVAEGKDLVFNHRLFFGGSGGCRRWAGSLRRA